MKALDKITKARTALILDQPFFGSLALRLNLVEDNKRKTTSINGESLFYNAAYVEKLSIRQMTGLLAHEVMHAALGHCWRIGSRDLRKWNIASDYAINQNLIDTGFALPDGALTSPAYDTLSTEEVYNLLSDQEPKESPQNQGNSSHENNKKEEEGAYGIDPGMCGAVEPAKAEEVKEQKAEWKAAVAQAVQLAKGTLPGNIKKQMVEILDPPLPWHVLLRDFVERTARNDYDWTRPSRRYIGQGIILPSLLSEQLPEIVIAIDTSGSIDTKALSRFATEASNVLEAYNTTIRVIYCDTRVHGEEIFTQADLPMKMHPVGGGGTNFAPVFEYVEKENIMPACLIYFTDLCGRFPIKEPEYPTMWLTTAEEGTAPFGITVRFKN